MLKVSFAYEARFLCLYSMFSILGACYDGGMV